jgi:hypothetical protein
MSKLLLITQNTVQLSNCLNNCLIVWLGGQILCLGYGSSPIIRISQALLSHSRIRVVSTISVCKRSTDTAEIIRGIVVKLGLIKAAGVFHFERGF